MASAPSAGGMRAEKMSQQRRRFSLQTSVNFINKMGRKWSIGSQHSGQSSRSSSCTGSLSNLSDHYVAERQFKFGGHSEERAGRSRWRKPAPASAHGSEEELNRRFADFDTYFGGFDDGPASPAGRPGPIPIILLQSADEDKEDNQQGGRQRSRSETRPPSHFSRLLKFHRRRPSQTENSPSPTSVTQSMEFPMPYERRGSFQSLSTLGVATPVLKCSLEQLPEGVQVHHATRTCSPSPEPLNGPSLSVHVNQTEEMMQPDKLGFNKSTFRDRSATFSSTDGLDQRRPSSSELSRPLQRERSVSFSATQAGSPSASRTPADDRTKKRRSLGYLFWPPSGLFSRSRTKSRSVDQSLAAAFDVDVIGGLSRLAGSALGSSTDSGGGGRAGSPIGERRSSGSGGSNSRLTEDTLAYTVQSNDTLTSLAARFDTTPSELVAINKLHSRLIFPGQVLLVPRKDGDASRGAGADSDGAGTSAAAAGESGPVGAHMSLNVSIRSSSSTSHTNINEIGRDSNGGYASPTSERPIEHAFLDSLRPPGSPRFNRVDLSFTSPNSGAAGQTGACASDLANIEREINNEDVLTQMDEEAERLRDRSAYEKFLKIHVRHITDGQGVVAGVLLVTPNTVMFDPNVSDTLVIEHGAEAYGVIAPMEFVVNAALYPDIAHMRLADSKGQPDQPITDPIYFPTNCPLHRKYALLKERAHLKEKETSSDPLAVELDPAAGILAIAGDIQRRWSEGEDSARGDDSRATAQGDALADSAASSVPATLQPVRNEEASKTRTSSISNDSVDGAVVTVTSKPVCPIIPPPSVVEAAHQSGHVIRLHVKNETLVPASVTDVPAGGPRKEELDLVDKSSLSSDNSLVSGMRIASSMDKTPSGERDDELCISEELNVTDDDDKDEAFHSSTGSAYEQAINEAMMDDSESRPRHSSTGTTSAMGPHQSGAARSRAMHSSFHRQPRHASGSEPIATSRPQSSSPAPIASSPETRGQRMLKRLSYPLVWMGESLTADSKENSPVLVADKDPNAESVFSKVFSSNHADQSVELSCDNSMASQTTDDSWVVPDFTEHTERSAILMAAAAAIAIGTIDGARRLSTENSLKLDSRLVPNLFRGKDQGHQQQQQQQHNASGQSSSGGAQPKLGYRSMVSVDDVPELFASLDKLIPKPAQPCDAPPLYLRLRMGKPLNRKGAMTTPIMSYGKKKMKPEYWFSIPRDKADSLCRFFLLWSPDVYGEPGDAECVAKRGFELITEDLEWEEPSPVRRQKPGKKSKGLSAGKTRSGEHDVTEDEDDPHGVASDLAKESWEIVSLNEEVRRALYGSERLSALDLDSYLPDLIGPTEVLTDEYRKQLAKHLPARVEGYPWTLVFSTSQNGFSLNSLYRKMIGIDSPILLVIEDTQGNVFGAITSCEIRVSESFYGTGESLLFAINPKMQIYPWSGDNSYFIQGNNESLAIGAGDGRFGLWLDGDLNQGRSQTCKTFGNDPLSPDEDFWVKTLECWAFM